MKKLNFDINVIFLVVKAYFFNHKTLKISYVSLFEFITIFSHHFIDTIFKFVFKRIFFLKCLREGIHIFLYFKR